MRAADVSITVKIGKHQRFRLNFCFQSQQPQVTWSILDEVSLAEAKTQADGFTSCLTVPQRRILLDWDCFCVFLRRLSCLMPRLLTMK